MESEHKRHEEVKLNEISATAVCGNDILSSVLYVSGFAIAFSGIYAPLVLIFIALILFFYKSVYTEVVEALPINGGAYNCLLNSTSKTVAAIAGVTTILSYIATAVISAKVAVEYLHTVLSFNVILATIALLGAFALLVIAGIKDSAKVALIIFSIHVVTLVIFVLFGIAYYLGGHSYFIENITHTSQIIAQRGSLFKALFFGFAASLLGVSGFESSANFVEEQQRGVFRKTLRNMLLAVAVFNPLVAIVSLNSAPISAIVKAQDFLLADMANIIGGPIIQYFVVADAFLVLSGAVLTSYVGVSGLMYRMSADGCLPNFLTKQNKKGSYPSIIIAFFALCTSILLLTKGNIASLAGVYTIAFLSVMSLFALGNLILRETRTELKRTYHAPIVFVVLAFCATASGIVGNILIDTNNFLYFALYFVPAVLLVLAIVYQDDNVRLLLKITRGIPVIHTYLLRHFNDMTSGTYIAFVHHVSRLYQILEYINRNEISRHIILVHCNNDKSHDYSESYKEMETVLPALRKAGAFPHFDVEVVYKNKPFGPAVIEEVSKEFNVRKNRIVIGSIHSHHPYEYSELGGVRIIF